MRYTDDFCFMAPSVGTVQQRFAKFGEILKKCEMEIAFDADQAF